MELIQLTSDYEMKLFDCGDAALNGFLCNDAKLFLEHQLARTYLLCDGEEIAAYFCLFNDKVSKLEVSNSAWRKIKKLFPHSKHFGSYPAVKIGRFAVSLRYRNQGLGVKLMQTIKRYLREDMGYSMFRFLTVDAYLTAVSFYEKNDFKPLASEGNKGNTQAMYFDMKLLPRP